MEGAVVVSRGSHTDQLSSNLDDIPTNIMSLFPTSAGIINRLDRVRRKFLWQGNKEREGYNLVEWKKVTVEKR